MYNNMAQQDLENEIKRERILKEIESAFCDEARKTHIFNLYGESGIGKSSICRYINNSNMITSERFKVLIDFNQIINKNIPGIIENVISQFGCIYFSETQNRLEKYYISIDASKAACLKRCITTFMDELNSFANDQEQPLLLIFDTYEALPLNVKSEFLQIITATQNNVFFLISGINRTDFAHSKGFRVDGFQEEEIQKYFIKRNPKMKSVFKKQGKLLASGIRSFTNEGHPILCGLLSDCTQHYRDINEQISYLIHEKKDKSFWHLVSWVEDLESNLQTALRLTAYFNDRMTPELLSEISGKSLETCRTCLQEMLNFSFVKCFSEFNDTNPQIVLHNIVANLIRNYYPYQDSELHSFAEKAVLAYDKMIAYDSNNIETFKNGKALRVEKVLCVVRNGEFDKALSLFDNELINGLDEFDYSFVSQLIAEIEAFHAKENDTKWAYLLQVAKAEYKLNQYDVISAISIFKELQTNKLYEIPIYKAIADSLFGCSLVNPSTVDGSKKPNDAIKILESCISSLKNHGLDNRIVKIYYWLGIAYVRTGQNDLAYNAFEEAKKRSTTDIQKVNILLEISKMLRLQQDVEEALNPLTESDRIMLILNKNKGKYYYYKGNVYRDLGNNDTAISYYNQAFLELKEGDDDFTLCELNLDYAWLEYLRLDDVDIMRLRQYLDTGWNYAQKYHFGTEFSEYYHILYEIENHLGQYEQAYKDLESALQYAYKYSNIYMILDCLNHKAQMHYRKKEHSLIPKVIEDMEKIENIGCKIRVFRGRAKLVQADVYYDEGKYKDALEEYFDGFLIVALYGNSHTNVELFEDLYYRNNIVDLLSRKDKIKICLSNVPKPSLYSVTCTSTIFQASMKSASSSQSRIAIRSKLKKERKRSRSLFRRFIKSTMEWIITSLVSFSLVTIQSSE